jgi:hypothetical protein
VRLWDLNRNLEEQIALLEKRALLEGKGRPIPKDWVEFDAEKGHYWRTLGNKKVMFDKGGRMINPPDWDEKETKGGKGSKDGNAKGKKPKGKSKTDSEKWNKQVTKKQHKALKKRQNQIDKIMGGKDHGFEAILDKKGNVVISNEKVEDAVDKDDDADGKGIFGGITGEGVWDLATAMVSMVDMYSSLLMRAGKGLSGVLGTAISDLNSALEDWQK